MKKEKVFEDVEVHNMDEMEQRQNRKRNAVEPQGKNVAWKAFSLVIALLALAYDLSPIDAIPDGIPVLGWLDDLCVTLVAALNMYQQFAKDQNSALVKLAKYIKWMLVALVIVAGIAVGGLVAAIVALVSN